NKLRAWKDSVLAKLSGGVAQLAKLRGVEVWNGRGYFEDSHTLRVETAEGQKLINYDQAIVAVGSKSALPKAFDLGNPLVMTSREALEVEDTKVLRDEKGFIKVNEKQQTEDPSIYAIGDVAGGVLLAHKASREARVAVEVILGGDSAFEDVVIPAVVFTDPELAWCGLTEAEARQKGITAEVAKFPWAASGRALSFDRPDGLTKLIIDPATERILGVGIVGAGAGELIAEGVLAIETGITAKDLALTVHPHPTLSETLMEAAEVFYGHPTHTFVKKKVLKEA